MRPTKDPATLDSELKRFLEKRDELFRNPSLKAARAFMPGPVGGWSDPNGLLAALHKARLQWIGATDAMLKESEEWLISHDYQINTSGVPPLTPERRDEERAMRGLSPLKGKP